MNDKNKCGDRFVTLASTCTTLPDICCCTYHTVSNVTFEIHMHVYILHLNKVPCMQSVPAS